MLAVPGMLSWRRWLSGAAMLVVAAVLLDPQGARAEPGVPAPPNGLLSDRGRGDLSDADRDFATKVRLAGLWEIPAGEMAQQRSDDPRIQSIGREIAAQHQILDKFVRDAAKKLDIALPDEPNADQQGWLDEMGNAEGTDFDKIYIDRLRAAHGKIFPAIATIRASTRNDTIRKLAQRTNQFVMTHMTLLESSGIVNFAALPTAPPPAAGNGGSASAVRVAATDNSETPSPITGTSMLLIVAAVLVSVAGTVFAMRRLSQAPRRRYRRQQGRYFES